MALCRCRSPLSCWRGFSTLDAARDGELPCSTRPKITRRTTLPHKSLSMTVGPRALGLSLPRRPGRRSSAAGPRAASRWRARARARRRRRRWLGSGLGLRLGLGLGLANPSNPNPPSPNPNQASAKRARPWSAEALRVWPFAQSGRSPTQRSASARACS